MTWARTAEHLLAEATWLRRLAAQLAHDSDEADDLVQDAWIAAWRKDPDPERPLRPWLAKVIRDAARMRRRADVRRTARDASVPVDDDAATPAELLAQARLYRLLVERVLALGEPYRSTVLARFVEGRTAADIARTSGIPEGTVRWRLKEALRRLRDDLDAHAVSRGWMPVVGSPALWASKAKTAGIVVGVVLALLLCLIGLGRLIGGGRSPEPPESTVPTSPGSAAESGKQQATEADEPVLMTWLPPANATVRAIAGRVVTESGAPIAGAVVQLQSWGSVIADRDEAQVITAEDGTFQFAPRWATRYVVAASASNRAPSSLAIDPRAPIDGLDPQQLLIVLGSCAQSAEGTVTDAGGGPIVGAEVRRLVTGALGPFGVAATTNVDGHYSLCLPRGTSWLDIGADGYEHVLREVTARGTLRVDVALAPGAVVTGRVVDTSTGEPIAGVWVGMWPMRRRSGEGGDRSTVSGDDGTFLIEGLAANRYELTARDRDHARVVIDEVLVDAGTNAKPITIRMERGVDVVGTVRNNGVPVPNVRVAFELRSGGAAVSSVDVVTDSAGAFVVHGVSSAPSVIPRVAGYQVRAPASVDTRASVRGLTLEVSPLGEIRGRVVRDGVPVPNASVNALGSSASLETACDGRGEFRIVGVSPGKYDLRAHSESMSAFSTKSIGVVVPSETEVEIALNGSAKIDGKVVDQNGAPVVGAHVIAAHLHQDDGGDATTTVDGHFSIEFLAAGEYRLSVWPFVGAERKLNWIGAPPDAIKLRGDRAQAGPVTLVVAQNKRAITGTVINGDGAPVADAIVRLGPVFGATTDVPIARTNGDGHFRLVAIGDGPFTLDAGTGSGPRARLGNVAGGASDVVLRLVAPGTIEGTLIGLTGVRVWARRTGGVDGAASVFGVRSIQPEGNRFTIEGLVPGDYVVTAVTTTGPTVAVAARVNDGAVVPVTLEAQPSRRITGRVTRFPDGAPIAGLRCAAATALGDVLPPGISGPNLHTAVTDAKGAFSLDLAPNDEALVLCFQQRGISAGAARVGRGSTAKVQVVTVPPRQPGAFGLWFDQTRFGAVVAGMSGDDVALKGIMPGDRVVEVDGTNVEALFMDAVYWLIAGRPYGKTVALTLERNGTRYSRTLTVTLPSGP